MSVDTVRPVSQKPVPRRRRHVPGEPELWLFIMGDLTVFAIFFGVWVVNYRKNPGTFELGRAAMSQPIGLAETLALITSSAAVVFALNRARAAKWSRARRCYRVAISLGIVFVILKIIEYSRHASAPIGGDGGEFYMYYFVFTGIHLLHVLVGLLGLSIAARSMRPEATRGLSVAAQEGIGAYWHMVDVLWVVLFSLIYLL